MAIYIGLLTRFSVPLDLKGQKDPSLLHCHLMLSDKVNDGIARHRELWFKRVAASRTPTQKGKDKKTVDPAQGGAKKTQARISQEWLGEVVRPLWAEMANQALERAKFSVRIDHRTLDAQREEAEQQAEQARERGDLAGYRKARERAASLDHPPQPKRGRVLEHAGSKKAPRQAAKVIDYAVAKAIRQQARAEMERMEAEAESARQAVERAKAVLEDARDRQQQRDVFERARISAKWQKRQQQRVDRELDAQAQAETRNGCRAGDAQRPWADYRQRILTEAYGAELGRTLGRWVKVERIKGSPPSLHIHNKQMDITDYGDRLVALQGASSPGGNAREIEALLKIAGAKGWKVLSMTGTEDFQMRAGAAALASGFELADKSLAERIIQQQVKMAPVLGTWMQAYPKQAKAQRLASGKLPLMVPDGLSRQDLQNPDVWRAADAWTVGRYGETKACQALSKDPDPLKARAAAAGREAAYNAWAQGGLSLQVGKDAPKGPGIAWTLSEVVTRESVEECARVLLDRRKRAGVDHRVTVTFGGVHLTEKILVLEHLLRQSVPLDVLALEQAGDGAALDQAQGRLNTHEPDGRQQSWYRLDLERKAARRRRDAAARKLEVLVSQLEQQGSADSARLFQEAGFVVDEKGFYGYPEPDSDLPGVQEAWNALAAVQRKELEADLQKRAEGVGYRVESGQWSVEQRNADPEYQRIAQELQNDPSLGNLAELAYKQGVDCARQEREARLAQARGDLRKAAHDLGRQMEANSNPVQEDRNRQEWVNLVQRGTGLGVDEKALSESLQGGRAACRQEVVLSNRRGMGL